MASLRKSLLITGGVLLALVVVGAPALVGIRPFIGPRARPLTDRRFEATPARLERGRYMVDSGTVPCKGCHSPLEVSGNELRVPSGRELSGRQWTPDGVPFLTAPNLTPDPETGIGRYTDDQLARAIREGISHDGRALFPIMPYEKFRAMPDEDLASVIVYLRSLPPVSPKAEEEEEDLGADIMKSSTDDIINRTRLLENDIKVNFHFFFRKIF